MDATEMGAHGVQEEESQIAREEGVQAEREQIAQEEDNEEERAQESQIAHEDRQAERIQESQRLQIVEAQAEDRAKEEGKMPPRTRWSTIELKELIRQWGNKFLEKNRKTIDHNSWKNIVECFNNVRGSEAKRTIKQCQEQIKSLKKRFNRETPKHPGSSYEGKWDLYHDLEEYISGEPIPISDHAEENANMGSRGHGSDGAVVLQQNPTRSSQQADLLNLLKEQILASMSVTLDKSLPTLMKQYQLEIGFVTKPTVSADHVTQEQEGDHAEPDHTEQEQL